MNKNKIKVIHYSLDFPEKVKFRYVTKNQFMSGLQRITIMVANQYAECDNYEDAVCILEQTECDEFARKKILYYIYDECVPLSNSSLNKR